jgi:hypothetical protein
MCNIQYLSTSIVYLFKNKGVYKQITSRHKNGKLEHNVLSHLIYRTTKIAVSLLSQNTYLNCSSDASDI